MRPVGSMVEFKQIVGRGTRVYTKERSLHHHRLYDNHTKFSDSDWDGPPEEIETKVITEVEENISIPEKTLKRRHR